MDDMGNYWSAESTDQESESREVRGSSSRKNSSRKDANSSPVRKQNKTMDSQDARAIDVGGRNSGGHKYDPTLRSETDPFEIDSIPFELANENRERLERPEEAGTFRERMERQEMLDARVANNASRRHIPNDVPSKLYLEVVPKNEDFFFSPYSVHSVMSMLLLGLRGISETEVKQVLGCDEKIHEDNLAVRKALLETVAGMVLSTANRMYVKQGYEPLNKFNEDCKKYYGAEAKSMDFIHNPEGSRNEINNWVQEQTRDKIKEIIAEGAINQNTRLILVNAIYFKGKWANEFDPILTRPCKFHVSESKDIDVDMMDQEGLFGSWSDTDFARMLEIDYRGGRVSMVLILPWTTFGLEEVEKAFNPVVLKNLRRFSEMRLTMPKFRIESSCSMVEAFKNLGANSIFDRNADLSGVSGTKDIHVTSIFHKAFIEVNEEGTEAAAADSMTVADCIPDTEPKRFYCDHPFMFVIRHKRTNTILFMGRYTGVEN